MSQTQFTLLFKIGFPAFMFVLCYLIGRWVERRHFRRIEAAESELKGILISTQRFLPATWKSENNGSLVCGNVVIATDYFKVVVSYFKGLFGGNLTEFETLLDRARREAIVRMLRQAQTQGANVVWNFRVETVFMGDPAGRPTGAEIVAYGTAFRME